jgi:hypothetical protein
MFNDTITKINTYKIEYQSNIDMFV